MFNPRFLTLSSMILLAALSRLMPHPWNDTPIAAMALFGGAHFEKTSAAYFVAFAALFLSDLFLGFHSTMLFVYVGFGLTVFLGTALKHNRTLMAVPMSAVASSLLFYLITNFGSWLTDPMYTKTLSGLLQSYLAGLPFLRNGLLGDLFYSGLLFGSFAWAQRRLPQLQFSSK